MTRNRKPPNWRSSRADFAAWLAEQGAEPLPLCQHEFARFRAHGVLCIVYERNRKGRQSMLPELAREAYEAWQARGTLDLSNPPPVPGIETFKARGARLLALHERQSAGDAIDLDAEAETFGLSPARLAATLTEWARSSGRATERERP